MATSRTYARWPAATVIATLLVAFLMAAAGPARACGWWGDGGTSGDEFEAVIIGADGQPVIDTETATNPTQPPMAGQPAPDCVKEPADCRLGQTPAPASTTATNETSTPVPTAR